MGEEEHRGLRGWTRFLFRRTGIAYTLLYAVPAITLIAAQQHIDSVTAEAITGNIKGHLLNVDLENLLQTQKPDKTLTDFMETVQKKKYYKNRAVIDSRVVHHRLYEVDGNPMVGKPCRPGSMVINSTRFEVRYLYTKEAIQEDSSSKSTISRREPPKLTSFEAFTTHCNKTDGKFCLAYQIKGENLHIVTGEETEDKNGLNTSEQHSKKYARIFLHRDWDKDEAETLVQLLLPKVNERYDDDPVVIIDAVWLLSLRKMDNGKGKVVPEECELVTVTTLPLPSLIIFGIFLLVTSVLVLYLVIRWLVQRRNDRAVLNECGTTKGLLWSYANEVNETEYNRTPDESPKVYITGSTESDHREQELVDVRPASRNRNQLEIS